jgi:hypothetical protein
MASMKFITQISQIEQSTPVGNAMQGKCREIYIFGVDMGLMNATRPDGVHLRPKASADCLQTKMAWNSTKIATQWPTRRIR